MIVGGVFFFHLGMPGAIMLYAVGMGGSIVNAVWPMRKVWLDTSLGGLTDTTRTQRLSMVLQTSGLRKEDQMRNLKSHRVGTFSWVELVTSDSHAAKRFYTELFGWQSEDQPMDSDMVYTMLKIDGLSLGGLYQMSEEQKNQGVTPHWNSYVTVKNADDTASKAKALDGTVIVEPCDFQGAGRMAVISDPTGASFCVWQPGQHMGAEILDEPGTLCWNELSTDNIQKANKFYAGLFRWKVETEDLGGMFYSFCHIGNDPVGGLYQPAPLDQVPPSWVVYIAVENCDATVAKALSLDSEVVEPAYDIPSVGRIAVLRDPYGATFGIMQGSSDFDAW